MVFNPLTGVFNTRDCLTRKYTFVLAVKVIFRESIGSCLRGGILAGYMALSYEADFKKRKKDRFMNRKLSFLLVLCLCASILCNTAMADVVNADDQNSGGEAAASGSVSSGFPDVPAVAPYAEAVKTLNEAGIIQGDTSGNFNPDRTVTRAQAAAFPCRMLGIEESAKVKKNTKFTDVPESYWASGYIAAIAEKGVISGYADGSFKPDNPVTYAQIIKMLVCAWGYENDANSRGGYPSGYIAFADSYGITAGISADSGNNCPRKDVAQLCYNTMSIAPGNFLDADI